MEQSQVQSRTTNRLRFLFGIVIAAIVFSLLFEGYIQLLPPHYNAISQPESDLAVGPYGFLMDINFVIRGVAYLIFLVAFMRAIPKNRQSRSGLILLGITAIGKIIIAFAVTDLTSPPHTIHGIIHTFAALISFFCGALGVLLLARALRRDPNANLPQSLLVGLATLTLIWSVIVIGTVVVSTHIGIWGLLERIYTLLFSLWMLILSLALRKYLSVPVTAE